MCDLLLYGRAYAEIVRSSDGRVPALWRLDPERMQVDRTPTRVKRWRYNGVDTWLFDPSTPPIFELSHRRRFVAVETSSARRAALLSTTPRSFCE